MADQKPKAEREAKPKHAVEMKEEELDQASGGAVDAFIYFTKPPDPAEPVGETKDTSYQPGRVK